MERIRKFVSRHPVVATLLLWPLVTGVAVGVYWLIVREIGSAVAYGIIMGSFYLWLPVGMALAQRRRAQRLLSEGRIRGFVRHVDSVPWSLADTWNPGEATASAGHLEFQPLQNDITVGKPLHFSVSGLESGDRTLTQRDKNFLGDPRLLPRQILILHTNKGDVEFAGSPETVQLLIERLEPDRQEA